MSFARMVPEEEIMDKDGFVAGEDLERSKASDDDYRSDNSQPVITYTPTDSLLIDRLIARSPLPRAWVIAAIGLALLLLPATFAYLDGVGIARLFAHFRAQFIYAAIVVYLLVVSHRVQGTREGVAQALRPIVQVHEQEFVALVRRSCRISLIGELAAFGIGMAIGLIVNIIFEPLESGPYFIERYAYLSRIGLYGAYNWTIYVIFSMTRLTNTLLRQPISVDIFDLKPFEPIGRQSLWLSLSIVGGVLLALVSSNFAAQELRLLYLISNSIMIAVILAVFFVNTHNVHRILAAAKRQQLGSVEQHFSQAYYRLEELISEKQDTNAVAMEINALAAAKRELKGTRTWPYNTEMLRTLFISIMTPIAVASSRLVAAFLANSGF